MFHNLAEDIVFVLIRLKILDIEQRSRYITVIEKVLWYICILIVATVTALLFNWFIRNVHVWDFKIVHVYKILKIILETVRIWVGNVYLK